MTTEEPKKSPTNFANLSPVKRAEIARRGGTEAHRLGKAHKFTSEEARAAWKKGFDTRMRNKAARDAEAAAKVEQQ